MEVAKEREEGLMADSVDPGSSGRLQRLLAFWWPVIGAAAIYDVVLAVIWGIFLK